MSSSRINTSSAFSMSVPKSKDDVSSSTALVSKECRVALQVLLQEDPLLSVVVESSSHPSGVDSILQQPWRYSGGGLGNPHECPYQTCLAGVSKDRSGLLFASACVPLQCTAHDLLSWQFITLLENESSRESSTEFARDYTQLHTRIANVNHMLHTGWVCGHYKVPWDPWGGSIYLIGMATLIVLALVGTLCRNTKRHILPTSMSTSTLASSLPTSAATSTHEEQTALLFLDDNHNNNNVLLQSQSSSPPTSPVSTSSFDTCTDPTTVDTPHHHWFWDSFNVHQHIQTICRPAQNPSTASLNGLKLASIAWVIWGHVLAIGSSSGGGYSNPADFLPPHGWTTTLGGQVLFAARFAVDTFLTLGGFLVVHALLRYPHTLQLHKLLLHRLWRLLPLYAACLGFWMHIAPNWNTPGPFSYQWQPLLEPCWNHGWTINWMFLNNFIPWDKPTTNTCFYHAWYLAVDLQLFLGAPFLVALYKKRPRWGMYTTLGLACASSVLTLYLAHLRHWSINTFDGAAVARFDVEGYAKPHIRAQAYLSGMLVAMLLDYPHDHNAPLEWFSTPRQHTTTWKHTGLLGVVLVLLATMVFGTVSGAYSQRPCSYQEWPHLHQCGSTWSPLLTLLYTGLSRAIWSFCISVILYLCLQGHGGWVQTLLELNIWTPLSRLTFGVYLIHPIVLFMAQLESQDKQVFGLMELGMTYVAVSVVSFVAAFGASVLVELPLQALERNWRNRRNHETTTTTTTTRYGTIREWKN